MLLLFYTGCFLSFSVDAIFISIQENKCVHKEQQHKSIFGPFALISILNVLENIKWIKLNKYIQEKNVLFNFQALVGDHKYSLKLSLVFASNAGCEEFIITFNMLCAIE